VVIECLLKSKTPLTPKKLLAKVKSDKKMQQVDPVSIYRVLDTLKTLGLVHQVAPDGGYLACDHIFCNHGMHIVVQCSNCGVAEETEIPNALSEEMKNSIKKQTGFEINEHFFQTTGTCKKCIK
jgi:Fur family zinc uptake transcriptional regulator